MMNELLFRLKTVWMAEPYLPSLTGPLDRPRWAMLDQLHKAGTLKQIAYLAGKTPLAVKETVRV